MKLFWKKAGMVCLVVVLLPFAPTSNYPSNEVSEVERSNLYNPHERAFTTDYERFASELLDETKTPGAAISIVRDDAILYSGGIGKKSSRDIAAVDDNTVFRIASLSKGFAGVLSSILADENYFDLNDCVRSHLPDFKLKSEVYANQLSIKHLLSHTTGLPRHSYTNLIERGDSLHHMVEHLKDVNMIAEPGVLYSYQNVAFSIISQIIKQTTGSTYGELLESRVFDPLKMEHATYNYDGIMNTVNVATPHGYGHNNWVPIEISDKYYNTLPAGGINASANDMAQWLKLLLGNYPEIIDEESLNELFTPLVETHIKYRYYRHWDNVEDAYYGLGWRVVVTEQDTIIHHGGYVNGYRNEIAFSPKHNIGICVLSNAPTDFAAKSIPAFFDLYEKYKSDIIEWEELVL